MAKKKHGRFEDKKNKFNVLVYNDPYSFRSHNSVTIFYTSMYDVVFALQPVSSFYKISNRLKIDKTSELIKFDQNLDVLFL